MKFTKQIVFLVLKCIQLIKYFICVFFKNRIQLSSFDFRPPLKTASRKNSYKKEN